VTRQDQTGAGLDHVREARARARVPESETGGLELLEELARDGEVKAAELCRERARHLGSAEDPLAAAPSHSFGAIWFNG
jgi:hypothetical protein